LAQMTARAEQSAQQGQGKETQPFCNCFHSFVCLFASEVAGRSPVQR
jgi:hypothetical protein